VLMRHLFWTEVEKRPMADIFISYKSRRRAAARHLCRILELHGYSVWFDYSLMSGKTDFSVQIEHELRSAKAVLVLWCGLSTKSKWVREEADLALELDTLIGAKIEPLSLPLGFRGSHVIDLCEWDGSPRGSELDPLFEQITKKVGRAPVSQYSGLKEFNQMWFDNGSNRLVDFALLPPQREVKRGLGGHVVDEQEQRLTIPSEAIVPIVTASEMPLDSVLTAVPPKIGSKILTENSKTHGEQTISKVDKSVSPRPNSSPAIGTSNLSISKIAENPKKPRVGLLIGFVVSALFGIVAITSERNVVPETNTSTLEDAEPAAEAIDAAAVDSVSMNDAKADVRFDPQSFAAASGKTGAVRFRISNFDISSELERRAATKGSLTAFNANDYSAVTRYLRAAQAGDKDGTFNLAAMLANGRGIARDEVAAEMFYRDAAAAGQRDAMYNLGLMLEHGQGIPKDLVEAASFYARAATAGDPDGMVKYGRALENGIGTAKDLSLAAQWYKAAAEAGNAWGMNNYGTMLFNASGVARNDQQAEYWWRRAAEIGGNGGAAAVTNLRTGLYINCTQNGETFVCPTSDSYAK